MPSDLIDVGNEVIHKFLLNRKSTEEQPLCSKHLCGLHYIFRNIQTYSQYILQEYIFQGYSLLMCYCTKRFLVQEHQLGS